MNQEHFLLNEVARQVRQKPYQITYLISIGVIPEPCLRISNKRVFTKKDIERIREIFHQRAALSGKAVARD